jgi:predicted DNA-binding transcriptional regulator AlpA
MTTAVDRLLSHREAARFLNIPVKTLYQMNWKKTGPRSFRVGRYRRYDLVDIKSWLDERASR